MKITFLGATETVTGSKYLLETKNNSILIDCGLFQGYKALRLRNRQALDINLDTLDAVLLTHTHLDHAGYVPVLYKSGYRGPIYTHPATRALCKILLADSGHIQESDARFFAKHKIGKHEKPEPLYDQAIAEESMKLFRCVQFQEPLQIGDFKVTFQSAGHILGAASIIVEADGKRVGFSGDVGRPDDIIMYPPKSLPPLDCLLLESTYGGRRHDPADPMLLLAKVVNQTAARGGVLLIPSFAVGRAQTLLHMLNVLIDNKAIPRLPIFLDSPMAINVTDIYCEFHQHHKLNKAECDDMCAATTFTKTVDESKGLAGISYPHIIIAGSGMATGGRILHHFKRLLSEPQTTVLFCGYQAGGTRGAKMLNGMDSIKIHGSWIPVKANVEMITGLSGHGDYVDIEQWLAQSELSAHCKIKLVHGSPDALEAMRDHLREKTEFDVEIAEYRQTIDI